MGQCVRQHWSVHLHCSMNVNYPCFDLGLHKHTSNFEQSWCKFSDVHFLYTLRTVITHVCACAERADKLIDLLE